MTHPPAPPPARLVFGRDSSGAVTALVNWRDNNAVTWRRAPAQRSAAEP
ncbi:MAG: hypothetical protein IRY91_14715 [Gemmatimonadaceae bacterium]|nr:hypothetical protein [Gemmatimonadaceae bacterium]